MKSTIISLVLLAALSATPITAAVSEAQPDARNNALDFLADFPPLKGVSLGMSEPTFLDLLKAQNLTYSGGQVRENESLYFVTARKDAVIIFTFTKGRCVGVQRGNGLSFG